jgi:hypothetical protein
VASNEAAKKPLKRMGIMDARAPNGRRNKPIELDRSMKAKSSRAASIRVEMARVIPHPNGGISPCVIFITGGRFL